MVQIELEKIVLNSYNPRKIFRGAEMEELKNNMVKTGQLHSVVLRPLPNEKFECIVGARRTIGAKELGWETIEATVREMTDLEAIYASFSENIKRVDLSPIELGNMYKIYAEYLDAEEKGLKKVEKFPKVSKKLTNKVAIEFEIDEKTVRNYVSLLKLPKKLQTVIEKGTMSYVYGTIIVRLPKEQMFKFYETYNPKDYTIKKYRELVNDKIAENKLEGNKLRKALETKQIKITLELESLNNKQENFVEKIDEILEALNEKYPTDDIQEAFDQDTAFEFLTEEMEKFNSQERIGEIAKELSNLEHQVSDLSVLTERAKADEFLHICPYCLARIDGKIITKRKGIFSENINSLNKELVEINKSADFVRENLRDLEVYIEGLDELTEDITEKEAELEEIETQIEEIGGVK